MFLHTDIGHDPDDIIALSYLITIGLVPDVVCVAPGYTEQVLLVDVIYNLFGQKRPRIYKASSTNKNYSNKESVKSLLLLAKKDNCEILLKPIECEKALVIGPATNLQLKTPLMFFQGGYSPNSIQPLEKFKNKYSVPSFNPNGAKKEFLQLRDSEEIDHKFYIGKNVCHGFTKETFLLIENIRFPSAIQDFFDNLPSTKAMHDVLAAKLCVDKNFGIWSQEMPIFDGNSMTTISTTNNIFTLIGLTDWENL